MQRPVIGVLVIGGLKTLIGRVRIRANRQDVNVTVPDPRDLRRKAATRAFSFGLFEHTSHQCSLVFLSYRFVAEIAHFAAQIRRFAHQSRYVLLDHRIEIWFRPHYGRCVRFLVDVTAVAVAATAVAPATVAVRVFVMVVVVVVVIVILLLRCSSSCGRIRIGQSCCNIAIGSAGGQCILSAVRHMEAGARII